MRTHFSTLVVLDIETSEILYRDRIPYDGPWELAIDSGPSQQTQDKESAVAQRQVAVAEQQNTRADDLYKSTKPGLDIAEQYYKKLSSGDPKELFTAIAPSVQAVNQQTTAAKQRIDEESPRGGTKNLAKQEADIAGAGQTSKLATQAYTSSFPALAALANQGIGLSINEIAQSLSGFQGGATTLGNVAQQQNAAKATTMGFIGSLANSAATGAGMAMA